MAKKQTAESWGFPSAGSNKGDNRPIVRRKHSGGGKPKLDKNGNLLPDSQTGK